MAIVQRLKPFTDSARQAELSSRRAAVVGLGFKRRAQAGRGELKGIVHCISCRHFLIKMVFSRANFFRSFARLNLKIRCLKPLLFFCHGHATTGQSSFEFGMTVARRLEQALSQQRDH